MNYSLSILICHLEDRAKQLATLRKSLHNQCFEKPVEVLVEGDNGERSIGEKRNSLLLRSKGAYIAFIDDDDSIADTYIDDILTAIKTVPDCVGIEGVINYRGEDRLFKHSIQFGDWYTGADGVFYRTPNHLNPIRQEIALEVGFPDTYNFGEDQKYSRRILPMLRSEVYIPKPLYYYNGAGMGYLSKLLHTVNHRR